MILPPPWSRVSSHSDKKRHYEAMRDEINKAKTSASLARATAREYRSRAADAEEEKKASDKKLLHLTKKQKAIEEGKKAGYWSGAAAISVTILYEIWKVEGVGYPGGRRWEGFWNHEAVYGVLMWFSTLMFAWFYRATQGD
jgi:hypothetical protein